jgi:hypothetical protein
MKIQSKRNLRIDPKKELNYLAWFYSISILLILVSELLAKDKTEYLSIQGKVVYFFFLLFIYRIFTINDWSEHYKEAINFVFGKGKSLKNKYVLSSVLNVLLDFLILVVMFFGIELEKVSFVRIPIAGLVYVLMMAFSALRRKGKLEG